MSDASASPAYRRAVKPGGSVSSVTGGGGAAVAAARRRAGNIARLRDSPTAYAFFRNVARRKPRDPTIACEGQQGTNHATSDAPHAPGVYRRHARTGRSPR